MKILVRKKVKRRRCVCWGCNESRNNYVAWAYSGKFFPEDHMAEENIQEYEEEVEVWKTVSNLTCISEGE